MVKYQLVYFNARGIAEGHRLLFNYAGVDFEDIRLSREEWPESDWKKKSPFGVLPLLVIDDVIYPEAKPSHRLLAHKLGLLGDTVEDAYRYDVLMNIEGDMGKPIPEMYMAMGDAAKLAELSKKFVEETLPKHCKNLEIFLGDRKFVLGDKVSAADLAFLEFSTWVTKFGGANALDKYTKITAWVKRIEADDKVAAYHAKRPVTDY